MTSRIIPPEAFRHPLVVQPADIDDLGHVNNVVYVRWAQEVAAAHWNYVAPDVFKANYAWVVLRHEVDYRNPAYLQDDVVGITWVGDHHGARFDRFVRICSGEEKILAAIKTTWCLLDASRNRPTRITEEILALL